MLIISATDYSNKEILYAEDFKKMIIGSVLSPGRKTINSLMFSGTDGDTGTNMGMTLIAAAEIADYSGSSIGGFQPSPPGAYHGRAIP